MLGQKKSSMNKFDGKTFTLSLERRITSRVSLLDKDAHTDEYELFKQYCTVNCSTVVGS